MSCAIFFLLTMLSLPWNFFSLSLIDTSFDGSVAENAISYDVSDCNSHLSLPDAMIENSHDLNLAPRDHNSCPTKAELIRPIFRKVLNGIWRAPKKLPAYSRNRRKTKWDYSVQCPEESTPIPLTCSGPEVWYDDKLGYVVDCVPGKHLFQGIFWFLC